MKTYPRLMDAKDALWDLTTDATNGLTTEARTVLFTICGDPVPPQWAVHGMEALWAIYDTLPDAGKEACGGCAQLVRQYGFFSRTARAFAIENIEAARQGDANADPTVSRPSPLTLETYDHDPNVPAAA